VDINELAILYKSWETEDLVRAATVDRSDYLPYYRGTTIA